jgi:hypothetical protein
MRFPIITLALMVLGCSHWTTSKVYIADDNQFGNISDGLPDKTHAITIKNSAGQITAQGEIAVYNGKDTHIKVGPWKEFYENGNVKTEGYYKIGSYIDCCTAGVCRQFYFYRTGQWRYFDSAGQLKYELEFTPETLKVDTNCEGGDKLIFGLVKSIPLKYRNRVTADDIYELQKGIFQ